LLVLFIKMDKSSKFTIPVTFWLVILAVVIFSIISIEPSSSQGEGDDSTSQISTNEDLHTTTTAEDEFIGYIIFTKFSLNSIPSGAEITSAKLILNATSIVGQTPTLFAYNCTTEWTESSSFSTVTTLPCTGTGNSVSVGSTGLKLWDITDAVKSAFNAGIENITIKLNSTRLIGVDSLEDGSFLTGGQDGEKIGYANFNSREAGAFTPVLNVTYATPLSSCTNITESGDYILTQDIINSSTSKCMDIRANNVTLDCQNHVIDGDDVTGYGIWVLRASQQSTDITIENCKVTDWDRHAIHFERADNNTFENLVLSSNPGDAMYIWNSDSNTFNNITSNSNPGFGSNGITLFGSDYNTLTNIITNSNGQFGLDLASADFNTFKNITANSNGEGGEIIGYGIFLLTSDFNTFTSVTANSNSHYGVYLARSDSNTLTDITANSNSQFGIFLDVALGTSDSNNISYSRIENNSWAGIRLISAGQNGPNRIYNNFFNNTINVNFTGTIYKNWWNTTRQNGTRIFSPGVEIGGNYWANASGAGYSDTCADADTDGFCDIYLNLTSDGLNADYLPLSDEYVP